MKILLLLTFIFHSQLNAASIKKSKSNARKPNQIQENYFRCEFQRFNTSQILFKINMRNPVYEDEMTYKESNRQLSLLVKLNKSGRVYFRLLNERSKEIVATGSAAVDFNQSFTVTGPDSESNWQLSCNI